MPYPSASNSRRIGSDRRKFDLLPASIMERRIQAERRGIEVVEGDFDERIALGRPRKPGSGKVTRSPIPTRRN